MTLDSPGQLWQVATNHSYTEYASSVRAELSTNSEAADILRDDQSTLAPFLVTRAAPRPLWTSR